MAQVLLKQVFQVKIYLDVSFLQLLELIKSKSIHHSNQYFQEVYPKMVHNKKLNMLTVTQHLLREILISYITQSREAL